MKSRTYPSMNRKMIRKAIMLDVREWQKIENELEISKALKKMRMLYGHMTMWEEKMAEIK